MEINAVKVVCFSPTGTTKAVTARVAEGIGAERAELIDITVPGARRQVLQASGSDVLVVAVPVYMGRVPALIQDWLKTIRAKNTAAVAVAVYGNRAFENALLELADLLTECGCRVIAGGAYVGEHSFSSADRPTAAGRPDEDDLRHAQEWGRRIRETLQQAADAEPLKQAALPGQRPYGGVTELWSVDFIAVDDSCTQCGGCAERCPSGAVAPGDSRRIDTEACITCCACIKNCPQQARSMKAGLVQEASDRLSNLYSERKEPAVFG